MDKCSIFGYGRKSVHLSAVPENMPDIYRTKIVTAFLSMADAQA